MRRIKKEKAEIKKYLGISDKTIIQRLEELQEFKDKLKISEYSYKQALDEIKRILQTDDTGDYDFLKWKLLNYISKGGGQGAKTGLYKIDLPDGDYTVRKLTPLECERLQTVPEGYTEGVSNTQRYKMLGNGWTVDVIAHILSGINLEGLI